MDCVFLHVHRTAGSTIWHNLVRLATERGRGICDLYHESKQQSVIPIHVTDILRQCRAKIGNISCIFHHHTMDPIFDEFEEQAVCATVLRDPVDRFVSLVYFMRSFLKNASIDPQYRFFYADLCGRAFYEAVDAGKSSDQLLEIAADQPYFQNHYLKLFSSLFDVGCRDLSSYPIEQCSMVGGRKNSAYSLSHGLQECGELRPGSSNSLAPRNGFSHDDGERHVHNICDSMELAQLVRDKFAVIGWFENLDRAYGDIVEAFGLGSQSDQLTLEVNRSESRPSMPAADRSRYERILELDYRFVEQLKRLEAPVLVKQV